MLLDSSLYICNITSEMCLFQQVMIFLCYLVPARVESPDTRQPLASRQRPVASSLAVEAFNTNQGHRLYGTVLVVPYIAIDRANYENF